MNQRKDRTKMTYSFELNEVFVINGPPPFKCTPKVVVEHIIQPWKWDPHYGSQLPPLQRCIKNRVGIFDTDDQALDAIKEYKEWLDNTPAHTCQRPANA